MWSLKIVFAWKIKFEFDQKIYSYVNFSFESIFKDFSITKDKTILLYYSLDSPIRRKYLINSPWNSFSFNRMI